MKKGEEFHPNVGSEGDAVTASPDLTPNIIINATMKHVVLTGNNKSKVPPENRSNIKPMRAGPATAAELLKR